MALNYSHRPLFPAHTVNGYLGEGTEKYGESYWRPLQTEMEEWNLRTKDRVEPESKVRDIVDLLPSDPFGMDIETTFTAITGWLKDLEIDYDGYYWSNSQEKYGLFAELNLIWNNALKSQPFSSTSSVLSNEKLNSSYVSSFSSSPQVYFSSCPQVYGEPDQTLYAINNEVRETLARYNNGFQPDLGFCNESTSCSHELLIGEEEVEGAAKSEEVPHDAFKFCLMYLGVKDLLSVERVCTALRSEVRGESLLWKSIHIDRPLSEKITDDILLELALRADRNLGCLSLVNCPKITDDGIKRVLETNPRVTKLSIPGCTGLSIKGILNNVSTHNSNKDVPGIKYLRISGIYGVSGEHYEEFKSLLGIDDSCHRPHFYHQVNFYHPYDDDRAIDIEMCPRCEEIRLVYDCPSKGCQVKDGASQVCRACILCIARCAQCGRCINDNKYWETFCLDLLCSDCFKQQRKYQDKLDMKVDPCLLTGA